MELFNTVVCMHAHVLEIFFGRMVCKLILFCFQTRSLLSQVHAQYAHMCQFKASLFIICFSLSLELQTRCAASLLSKVWIRFEAHCRS